MAETGPGLFEGDGLTGDEGVYRIRVMAHGQTLRARPFTRERLLSAVAVRGGDQPGRTSDSLGPPWRKELCELLECLWSERSLQQFMAERNLDHEGVRKCLAAWCARPAGESAAALAERASLLVRTASTTGELSREEALLRILGDALRSRESLSTSVPAKLASGRNVRRGPRGGGKG
jgi:hypothetical protein